MTATATRTRRKPAPAAPARCEHPSHLPSQREVRYLHHECLDARQSEPTPGEQVLARLMALGDAEPLSPDYQRAIADVLAVLTDCAPACHEAGHR